MSTNWIALLGASALAAPLFCTIGTCNIGTGTAETCMLSEEAQGGLTRVRAQDASTFDARAWKDRLTARDLDARERDFEKLAELARTDDAAHAQLKAWARDDGDADLAWTSRLLLREARTRNARTQPFAATPQDPQWNDLRARLDEMQHRFGNMDHMFDELQQDMDRAFGGAPGVRFHAFPPSSGGLQKSQTQIYSMQVGPDGVKVEVSEDVDGKQEKKTYSAKTLEELYEAHPELKDKMGARIDVRPGQDFFGRGQSSDPFGAWRGPRAEELDRPARPLVPSELRTDILGVQISAPDTEESEHAGLDEGVGLKVQSVNPGTIAARIGIEAGDIVIDVNGKTIRSTEDVRDTLRDRKSGDDVSVTIVDAAGKRRVLTWRAGNDEKKDAGKKPEERRF